MSPIVEFSLFNPVLQETRRTFPELLIQIEDEYVSSDGSPEIVILSTGGEDQLTSLEEQLSTDPSIEDYELLAEFSDSELIRITLSESGFRGMTYPIAVNLGITFLHVKARGERMRYRAQVPTMEALSEYRAHCSDRDLQFKLITIHQSKSLDQKEYGLTDRQREVLRYALNEGYFEVPRQITLEKIAAEFDISDQALSALFRRGQAQLLQHTIGSES